MFTSIYRETIKILLYLIRAALRKVLLKAKLNREWHGLVVSVEACHYKGRGIESRLRQFLLSFFWWKHKATQNRWKRKRSDEETEA